MHDLLQDMGREIVRQESCKEPGKRSRLWFHEDIRHVFEENTGTDKIEGILVNLPERDLRYLSSETFEKMTRLRLFINYNAHFSGSLRYLSNELRVLDWHKCLLQSFPSNFRGKNLLVLRIHNSPLKLPKEGFKNFQNLRTMKFSECKFLTEIPDTSGIPNLDVLEVDKCESLVKVHDSVGYLNKLTRLHFRQCSSLVTLPRSLKLRSLETIEFVSCARLRNFPEIECKMERLKTLLLRSCISIKELPSSIAYLTGIELLSIRDCENLILPSSLQLQPLNIVGHERCSKVDKLPTKVRDERESMLSVVSTEESEISSSTKLFASLPLVNECIFDDGRSSIVFPALRMLTCARCMIKPEFLMTPNCFASLDHLCLQGTDIVRLPACIKRFVRLTRLYLKGNKQLREIPELPPNIKAIHANGCVSLESFPDLSNKLQSHTSALRAVEWLDLSDCHKLAVKIGNELVENYFLLDEGRPFMDHFGGGIAFPGNRIPAWFSHSTQNNNSSYNSGAIDINGFPNLDEIKGIVFCAVFGIITGSSQQDEQGGFDFFISSKGTELDHITGPSGTVSDHVWLQYLILEPLELEGNLQAVFLLSFHWFIKSCGVHLIHKHEENVKDHPSLTQVDFNFCKWRNSESSAEEDDCDEIERVLDGIQPSERQREAEDEDDCNSESSYYPQQKKRSSTMGESQLNQSNHSQC